MSASRDTHECCGAPCFFDETIVGETCGGLTLRGWWRCLLCGGCYLGPKDRVVVWERWKLAAGGRSVDVGFGRIRLDGAGRAADAVELCKRLVKLPDLELLAALVRAGKMDEASLLARSLQGEHHDDIADGPAQIGVER